MLFYVHFFQYASFIAAGLQPPGSIGDISLDPSHHSVYSFVHLVGCAYFRLHASAFEHMSPVTLHNSLGDTHSPWETHVEWLSLIRNGVWLRADCESLNVPSADALQLHWQRCLWVLHMWNLCLGNEIELPGMSR